MIKIQNLNKYYAKSKSNELHVINDTSIDLPTVGLVSFIGKSGSGKTTLLNVIGGLDKENSGTIQYDNDLILNKYNMGKIDSFRKNNVGYIFQNYLLLENRSVYDNLRIALEIIGILDPEEQKKRIEYVLKAVGLFKYRKKMADKLSGGQMQRVSIARALIKECKIIIADEPTGNLDSENTIEVMNILKKISEKTLVLLVTHNKQIADFYSDRVIELSDGKIICDYKNEGSFQEQRLDVKNERQIYLKDLTKQEINLDSLKINLFTTGENGLTELNIVIKNDTVYIDSSKNIQLVNQSNVELIDAHYKHLDKKELKTFDFDISWYEKTKKRSVFLLFFRSLKTSFLTFIHSSKKSKVFKLIFFALGVVMACCAIAGISLSGTDDRLYSTEDVSCMINKGDDISYNYWPKASSNKIRKAIKDGTIDEVYKYTGYFDELKNSYNSVREESQQVRLYTYPYSRAAEATLAIGSIPTNDQVVIGKELADFIIENMDTISEYQQIIGMSISEHPICGISNKKTNSIYFEDKVYYTVQAKNIMKTEFFYDQVVATENNDLIANSTYEDYTIVNGRDVKDETELVINSLYIDNFKLNQQVFDESSNSFTVVGFYTNNNFKALSLNIGIIGKTLSDRISSAPYATYKYERQDFHDFKINTQRDSSSRDIASFDECLVNVQSKFNIGQTITNDNYDSFKVVGYYSTSTNSVDIDTILFNKIGFNLCYYGVDSLGFSFSIAPENIPAIETLELTVFTPYTFQRAYDLKESETSNLILLVVVIVLLIFSVVYVYFTTRSKLISQVGDVGVFRSIGASRMFIIRRYLANIFVETSLTSLLGYLLTIFVYTYVSIKLNSIVGQYTYHIDFGFYILGALFLYLINFIFGLIPVITLLRKTPAEINSKYDI